MVSLKWHQFMYNKQLNGFIVYSKPSIALTHRGSVSACKNPIHKWTKWKIKHWGIIEININVRIEWLLINQFLVLMKGNFDVYTTSHTAGIEPFVFVHGPTPAHKHPKKTLKSKNSARMCCCEKRKNRNRKKTEKNDRLRTINGQALRWTIQFSTR